MSYISECVLLGVHGIRDIVKVIYHSIQTAPCNICTKTVQ